MRSRISLYIAIGLLLWALVPHVAADTTRANTSAAAKFPTDNSIRSGFVAIRDIVLRNHTLITHRRISGDAASKFSQDVIRELDRMILSTVAEGKARAALIAIAGSIESGVKKIAAAPTSTAAMDGIVNIDAALQRYPLTFEHPDWQPLR